MFRVVHLSPFMEREKQSTTHVDGLHIECGFNVT